MTKLDYLLLCLIRRDNGICDADSLATLLEMPHRNEIQRLIVSLYRKKLIKNLLQPKLTELGERVADGHYLIFSGNQISVGELVRQL